MGSLLDNLRGSKRGSRKSTRGGSRTSTRARKGSSVQVAGRTGGRRR